MSERAAQLANETDATIQDVITFIEGVPDAKWEAFCEPEQCTVAALASHMELSTPGVMTYLVMPIAEGKPLAGLTPEQIHAGNAQNARENARRPRAEVLQGLRALGPEVSGAIRGLSDEQLQRSAVLFFRPEPVTADFVIENVVIGHLRGHLESMRAAVA